MSILLFLLLLCFGCTDHSTEPTDGEPPLSRLKPDMTNIAVLFVNYLSGEFEGGSLRSFAPRDSVIANSLPFTAEFIASDNVSRIEFFYEVTGDCIFAGGIYWDNSVGINMPVYIDTPDEFGLLADSVSLPESVTYIEAFAYGSGYPNSSENFRTMAASAWKSVQRLDIVSDFALNYFQVGFYLFPPAVKPFDLQDASWVIFLYQDKL